MNQAISPVIRAVSALVAVCAVVLASPGVGYGAPAGPGGGPAGASSGPGTSASSAPGAPGTPAPSGLTSSATQSAEVIVKIDVAAGYTIGGLTAACPVVVESAILASRGIYLVRGPGTDGKGDSGADQLAKSLSHQPGVVYAEPNSLLQLDDTRWHAWSDGVLADAGYDPQAFTSQPAVTILGLTSAWAVNRGAGTTVAVLDTGADASHPALSGRLTPGWDYVDDDPDTSEEHSAPVDGQVAADDAFGHGTFVAGMVGLVAPEAKIMPERVLRPDGSGNVFVIAQAILDAVGAGANVINLSFGGSVAIPSHLLTDAISFAQARGVVVTAAAGNDHNDAPHFPAATRGVLSVSALAESGSGLASYADFGPWVDVAAPGTSVVGPVPGGGYASWSGTSMATPFASGQAALLHALWPRATSDQLVALIGQTAARVDNTRLAFGQINIPRSLLVRLPRP